MTPQSRRNIAWLPLCSLLAIWPAAWFATTASAEARKFVVILANPSKTRNSNEPLPNRGDIWDQYFDQEKDGQNGGPRVDSHAEWWEEISYGTVTVSGDVYGWINLPWGTVPPSGGENGAVLPHIDLLDSFNYNAGEGEFFNNGAGKWEVDFDGAGTNPQFGNNQPFPQAGAGHVDTFNRPVFCPGERFLDLNGDRRYQAGVAEWGIDKNGNGMIDVDPPGDVVRYNANSFAELFACDLDYPDNVDFPGDVDPDGEERTFFLRWQNETEWFDSNHDTRWNADGNARQVPLPWAAFGAPAIDDDGDEYFATFDMWWGDWGGTEILIQRGDSQGNDSTRAQPMDDEDPDFGGPATMWRYLQESNKPDGADVDYFDQQWNNVHDFPEPFEDYMRTWNPFAHQFVPMDDEYIAANYPGPIQALQTFDIETIDTPEVNPIGRTGNGRYDWHDAWSNRGSVANTNKRQPVWGELADGAEFTAQAAFWRPITLPPEFYNIAPPSAGPAGWSLDDFWQERYGSIAPQWEAVIPYMRIFNPNIEQPLLRGDTDTENERIPFVPNRGGPTNFGVKLDGERYDNGDGTVLPNVRDGRDGFYDGPREFDDLPSSIYHSGGDTGFGEVTSPINNDAWGQDIGPHETNAASNPDGFLVAAGPPAFLVHGDSGWDAGNVMVLEFLTWRQDGTSSADIAEGVDTDGDGIPDDFTVQYHKDVNLDGLMDVGESIGDPATYGVPLTPYYNYGTDADPGTPNNGDPSNPYPFSRVRAMEDSVAALDNVVDWDNFLGGPDRPFAGCPPTASAGNFGNRISGLILLPDTTGPNGMFTLPAGGFAAIRTRDRLVQGEIGRNRFQEIDFVDGLGISFDGEGEGGGFSNIGSFGTAFAGHEYGHRWEGWKDLYDYDTYSPFPVNILNNPVNQWCVMAGGGLCHPVPVLKECSGWLDAIDITRVVGLRQNTTIRFTPWEFNSFRTVYKYANPSYPGEQFYMWRTHDGIGQPSFDRVQPDQGLLIMHIDRGTNPEALPPQQRIASHHTYQIVQADGDQALENGENADAGDVWPGTSNATQWTRNSDPNNRWFDGQGSGLEIVNIVDNGDSTDVTFRWRPQEVPSLDFVQPPGGTSILGRYPIKYFAFDQFGGTTLEFYAFKNEQGLPLSYDGAIPLGNSTKTAGEVDGTFTAQIGFLPDGTYTFFVKLVPGIGDDGMRENSNSIPRASIDNLGTGNLTVNVVDMAISRQEAWTVTCTSAIANAESWRVTGSESGVQVGVATTGLPYSTDTIIGSDNVPRNALSFVIFPGAIPFRVGDSFSFLTTGLTPHSAAVLIDDGEVVTPQPPIAEATLETGNATGLAPHAVVFRHNTSRDPRGAALSYSWDFGDGSQIITTTNADEPLPHTYTIPRTQPYLATLTVTNSFGLSAQDVIAIQVNSAAPPTVRVNVQPTSGQQPLRVRFDASATTDPNPGVQGLDFVLSFGDGSAPVVLPLGETIAEHVYDKAGIYRATLTVTNRPYNKSASETIEIRVAGPPADQPPTASIESSVRFGTAPLKVSFSGEDSTDPEGAPLDFAWNFGDGTALVRGVSQVDHTFTRQGTFNVTLSVTDRSGQSDSATLAIVITGGDTLGNQSPVARIVASTTQGAAPLTVQLDASASADPEGGPLAFAWDFGDGSPQVEGVAVSHVYTTPKRYSVVLVVADSKGATGATTIDIVVNAPDDQSGLDNPGTDPITDVTACGNAGGVCGPVGMMPMALTMVCLSGMKLARRRR